MDTITYASVAVLPWSVAQNNQRAGISEAEFDPLELSYISSSWTRLFQATGPCDDL